MDMLTLQVAQRGIITLPKAVRDRYRLRPGDVITLLDMDGVLVLSPGRSEVDLLADRIARDLAARGESLPSMLQALREARERYAP